MPGQLDANIKLLYAADLNSTATADTVDSTVGFDVLADIELGEFLHGTGGEYSLHVTVRNLSQSSTVFDTTKTVTVPAGTGTFTTLEKVTVPPFTANSLDLLDAVAVFKFKLGLNTDFSVAFAQPFVVA
jgi:hypothetical protein